MRTLVLSLLLAVVAGCADHAWKETVAAGNAAAYANYARTHPGTARGNGAARRAESLAWDEAVAANTSVAFESFRGAYPSSPHAEEAATRAESLAWEEAGKAGAAGYTLYLARYPRSPRAPEAEARIEELVWQEATTAHTEDAYGRYLLRYPNGPHAGQARQQREDLAWAACTKADTVDAYDRFLRKYEGGAHTAEAKAWLDATKVRRLHPVVVLLNSWLDDKQRATILARYRSEFDRQVLAGLGQEFGMEPISLVDAKKVPWTHPHDLFGAVTETGVLVLEVTEKRGAAFEPDGHATNVEAKLSFYAPNTRTPVIERTFRAATPAKVKGIDESSLHQGAVKAAVEQVRAAEAEIVRQRKAP